MRVLALLCVGLALVAARPDVSHLKTGYNYDKPTSTHFVAPAQTFTSGSFNTPRFDTAGSGNHGQFVQPQQTYVQPQQTYVQPQQTYVQPQQTYVQPQQTVVHHHVQPQQTYVQPQQTFVQHHAQPEQKYYTGFVNGASNNQGGNYQADTFSSGSGASNVNRFSGDNYQQRNLEPIVTKNFFVHSAPEERQVVQLRVVQEQARPRKNYNVIFVKTPSSAVFKAPVIQQQAQNEDKTLVYVLSKNQAHAEDIVIPAAAPAIPTKPEVFFIKYKNQHDADHKIQEIQSNYNQGNLNFNPQGLATSAHVDGPQLSSFTTTNTRFGDESSLGSGNGGSFVSQPATSFSTGGSSNSGFVSQPAVSFSTGGSSDSGFVSQPATSFSTGGSSDSGFVSQPATSFSTEGSSDSGFVSQPAVSFSTGGSSDSGFGLGGSSGGFVSGGSVGHGDSGSSSTGTSHTVISGGSVGSDNEVEYLPANH